MGYRWFSNRYLPAAQIVEAAGETELACDAWQFAGDVYLLIHAPRACIRSHRKALSIMPENLYSLTEICARHLQGGDWPAAKRLLRRARAAQGDDGSCISSISSLEHDIRERVGQCYKPGDLEWDVAEALAADRAEEALQLLEGKRAIRARQLRIRAYGAAGDTSAIYTEWAGIVRSKGTVSMEEVDWFYQPDRVWNAPKFWEYMLALGDRIEDGWWPLEPQLLKLIPEPRHRGSHGPEEHPTRAAHGRFARRMRLMFQLHLARTRKDIRLAETLCRRYPEWKEPHRLLRRLSRRAPT